MARGTCWKGFQQKGFKKKGRKLVANCVKVGAAEGGIARIPRKPGQPAKSKKHSDLYTDENPKGTIRGLKFATESDAKKSVTKIKKSGRSGAHKIQAAVAMEQRAGVMGKASSAGVYRKFIDSVKAKKAEGGLISGIPKLTNKGWN